MPSASEAHVVAAILHRIGERYPQARCWRNNTGALRDPTGRLIRFGLPGSADILGLIGPEGRFLAIECKTQRGRQTEQQRKFQAMVERHGGLYVLARKAEDVDNALGPL